MAVLANQNLSEDIFPQLKPWMFTALRGEKHQHLNYILIITTVHRKVNMLY